MAMRLLGPALAAGSILPGAGAAGAATIEWALDLGDPFFEQTLDGSFRFDTVTQAFSGASLVFGHDGVGTVFDVFGASRSSPGALVLFTAGTNLPGSLRSAEYLILESAGGAWGDLGSSLGRADVIFCFDDACGEADLEERSFADQGTVTATVIGEEPEPPPPMSRRPPTGAAA